MYGCNDSGIYTWYRLASCSSVMDFASSTIVAGSLNLAYVLATISPIRVVNFSICKTYSSVEVCNRFFINVMSCSNSVGSSAEVGLDGVGCPSVRP